MKIAICEDNNLFLEDIVSKCKLYLNEREIDEHLLTFKSAEEFILRKPEVDVLLLDIELGEISGIDLKNIMEENNDQTPIIFMTCYTEYMHEAFGLYVISYLDKPIEKEKLFKELDKIRKKLLYNPVLETGMLEEPCVYIKDILYVKYEKDYPLIKTKDKTIIVKGSLSIFEEKLSGFGFFRANKSYIVNLEEISKKEDSLILPDGHLISLSRRKKSDFKNKYMEFLSEKFS